MTSAPTAVPSENDFLAAFGIAPVESQPADGYWSYSFSGDNEDEELLFSFNAHERSVQTVWVAQGRQVCTVVHENAATVRIVQSHGRSALVVEFVHEPGECQTHLQVQILPGPQVHWSSVLK